MNLILNQKFENGNKIYYNNLIYLDVLKNKEEYILFLSDDFNFYITFNKYLNIDSKIMYNVTLESKIKYLNNDLSLINLKKYIEKYIKIGLYNKDKFLNSIFDYEENFIDYLKENDFDKINESIDNKSKKVQESFLLDESNFEYDMNLFNQIKSNNLFLNDLSDKILDYYFLNTKKAYFKISDVYSKNEGDFSELVISKLHIDEMIKFLSFKVLNMFFNKYTVIEILKIFSNIKLSGKILKTDAFFDVLKEFLPGSLINKSKSKKETSFEIFKNLDKMQFLGNLKIEYKLKELKYDYELFYIDYKKEKNKILSSKSDKFSYIDKSIETKILKLKIKYIYEFNENDIEDIILDFNREYIEIDEEELIKINKIGIQSDCINEITNDIIRIFFYNQSNKIELLFVRRITDQIYMNKTFICLK